MTIPTNPSPNGAPDIPDQPDLPDQPDVPDPPETGMTTCPSCCERFDPVAHRSPGPVNERQLGGHEDLGRCPHCGHEFALSPTTQR